MKKTGTFYRPEHARISSKTTVQLCGDILMMNDPRLMKHGERVAWIAHTMQQMLPQAQRLDEKNLLLLCLFHDVGAYKTEEINRMIEFESSRVQAHSIYGYLFLKYFTPLRPVSEAILYHHLPHSQFPKLTTDCQQYAEVIQLADRADIAICGGQTKENLYTALRGERFNVFWADIFQKTVESTRILEEIRTGDYEGLLYQRLAALDFSASETMSYLEMLIHTIDFKSEFTAVHSVNTTVISTVLAELMNLPRDEIENIYYAALVHDIGKMAIPEKILEYPGRLTPEQMIVMREHVGYTEKMIHKILPPEITRIAIRHHEKLDGSGYPYGLTAKDLSVSDRIVAVGDIASALSGRRSYKDSFPKEKTLNILTQMEQDGQLDSDVVHTAVEHYNEIFAAVSAVSDPILEHYHAMQKEYSSLMSQPAFQE
ncbi:MAG: HD domain-containing protein [Oscillibacter sp.]|jgi:HD-GYP domain-containing protein (c-di-GMP phosphodiesterase class II)|nr:HD domain-containing protein [Oscillibacter sp.]